MSVAHRVLVEVDGKPYELADFQLVTRRYCDRCQSQIGDGEVYIHLINGPPADALRIAVDPSGRPVSMSDVPHQALDLCAKPCGALFEQFVGANGAAN